MKHYFIELTASYIAKNKAHSEIQNFVRHYNGMLVDIHGKTLVKSAIVQKIKEVNNQFTRCNNIELSGWNHLDEVIAVDGNFILAFKEVKSYKLVAGLDPES